MNLLEVARFSMMMDVVVGRPAEYALILSNFVSKDYDVQQYAYILSTVFGGLPAPILCAEDENARLIALDSLAGALQTRHGGYDKAVGEMVASAVAKRRLALVGRHVDYLRLVKLLRKFV